jgi:dTDP-4-dehydrorhamnose 3,5-epimerase
MGDGSMELTRLPLEGLMAFRFEEHRDERGSFARIWDAEELARAGLRSDLAQSSVSSTPRRGTLRGLHYQVAPHEETKLVTCVRGSIFDVAVDLRPGSATFRRWHAERLEGASLRSLYVPEGFAHGFLTLSDDVLVVYQISGEYDPGSARGVRWNDPAFGIEWPGPPVVISQRDQSFDDFRPDR